jgi:hypothetical protein
MPALNIQFTEAELARLRERARRTGVSMRRMAHDMLVTCTDQSDEDDLIMVAYNRIKPLTEDILDWLKDR